MNQKRQAASRLIWIAAVLGILVSTGCGSKFEGTRELASTEGGLGSTPTVPVDPWEKISFEGAVSGGTYNATPVVSLDKVNKMLLITVPMPLVIPGAELKLEDLPGGKVTWEKLADGTPAIMVHIPLEKFLRGVDFPAVDSLPTGDKLIDLGIPDGELPSFAVSLPVRNVKLHIYLGVGVVAVFAALPTNPPIGIGPLPILNKDKTRTVGYFALLTGNSTQNGGFYLSAQMPDDLARIIDEIL